jgi:hypothetical protein
VVDGAGDEASPAPDALRPGDLCLVAKADLPVGDAAARTLAEAAALGLEPHRLSAHRDEDIAALEAVLSQHVIAALGSAEPPSATRLRHAALLAEAVQRLESALGLSAEPELAAPGPSIGSLARSVRRMSWTASSRPSASASELFHVKHRLIWCRTSPPVSAQGTARTHVGCHRHWRRPRRL